MDLIISKDGGYYIFERAEYSPGTTTLFNCWFVRGGKRGNNRLFSKCIIHSRIILKTIKYLPQFDFKAPDAKEKINSFLVTKGFSDFIKNYKRR